MAFNKPQIIQMSPPLRHVLLTNNQNIYCMMSIEDEFLVPVGLNSRSLAAVELVEKR